MKATAAIILMVFFVLGCTKPENPSNGGNDSGGNEINAPVGAIKGLFSVNSNKQVFFSKGNLQFQASTNTWRFANNQYDFIGFNNANISSTCSEWIDLFGWGTSGFNHGAIAYQPWSTSERNMDYYPYDPSTYYNLCDQTGRADWGYNAISNGGNAMCQWRTLTQTEWDYVFNLRTTASNVRYAKAKINGINGVVLLPDSWNTSTYQLMNVNNAGSYDSNEIDASDWLNILQKNGAVFLPAAGNRVGSSYYNNSGDYWSASHNGEREACEVWFVNSKLKTDFSAPRHYGLSVRLVQDNKKTEYYNGSGSLNNHSYVNLGLPSGTLWSTCNIGADTLYDCGNYFSWAEIEPKNTYSWNTYKYCNDGMDKLTKYCHNSNCGNNGFTDDLTSYEIDDDAATINWGEGWRTPTYTDLEELIRHCTISQTCINGIKGMCITGKNGKSIFLPAIGYIVNNTKEYEGVACYYWSSSLNVFNEGAYLAWSTSIHQADNPGLYTSLRANGLPIRPVCSSQ